MGLRGRRLGSPLSLSFSNSLFKTDKIKRKKKGRKERLEKELGTGIISTDSSKCARSMKNRSGKIAGIKFKVI